MAVSGDAVVGVAAGRNTGIGAVLACAVPAGGRESAGICAIRGTMEGIAAVDASAGAAAADTYKSGDHSRRI